MSEGLLDFIFSELKDDMGVRPTRWIVHRPGRYGQRIEHVEHEIELELWGDAKYVKLIRPCYGLLSIQDDWKFVPVIKEVIAAQMKMGILYKNGKPRSWLRRVAAFCGF